MKTYRIVLLIVLTSVLLIGFLGEKIPINDGLGWDGISYAEITQDFDEDFLNGEIDSYRFQRILLPLLINKSMHVLGIPLTNSAIITAYSVANLLFIGLSVYLFFLLASQIQLKPAVEIIGFSSLFFCFPILKFSLYYPILTDTMAFCLGMAFSYFYVSRKIVLCFLIIFLGTFVYPNFILFGLLLFFVFEPPETGGIPWLPKLARLGLIGFFALLIVYFYVVRDFPLIPEKLKVTPVNQALLIPSVIGVLAYLYLTNALISLRQHILVFYRAIQIRHVLYFIVVFGLSKLIISLFAAKGGFPIDFKTYLYNVVSQAITNPLNFWVAHVMYLGLAPLLLIFLASTFREKVLNHGYGALGFILAFGFFAIGNESRQLINVYPVFMIFLLLAMQQRWDISPAFAYSYAAVSLLLSRFWYSINANGNFQHEGGDTTGFMEFPLQQYFMFQGPWTSHWMYGIHLLVCCLLLAGLLLAIYRWKVIQELKAEGQQE
ncbi:MAG: hypothetical protein AAF587_04175 [Bacteroidota bacterium]